MGQGGDGGFCTDNALLFYCLMTHHLGYWYCLRFFFLGGGRVVEILLIFEINFGIYSRVWDAFSLNKIAYTAKDPHPPPHGVFCT